MIALVAVALVVTVENRGRVAREMIDDLASADVEALQLGVVTPTEARGIGDDQVRRTFTPVGPGERLRAVVSFSIDQQHPGLRARHASSASSTPSSWCC